MSITIIHLVSIDVESRPLIIGKEIANIPPDYAKYLRKDDLKTPVQIPKDLVAEVYQQQLKTIF